MRLDLQKQLGGIGSLLAFARFQGLRNLAPRLCRRGFALIMSRTPFHCLRDSTAMFGRKAYAFLPSRVVAAVFWRLFFAFQCLRYSTTVVRRVLMSFARLIAFFYLTHFETGFQET